MPLFGKDAKLYYSTVAYSGSNDPDDLTWVELTKVQDQTDNFSPIEDDVTTRAIAASGVAASAIVLSEVEISFSYIMDSITSDTVFDALWTAFTTRAAFTALTMSGDKATASGAYVGFSANFSVALNWQKNIRNKQLANFSLKVLQYPFWVDSDTTL